MFLYFNWSEHRGRHTSRGLRNCHGVSVMSAAKPFYKEMNEDAFWDWVRPTIKGLRKDIIRACQEIRKIRNQEIWYGDGVRGIHGELERAKWNVNIQVSRDKIKILEREIDRRLVNLFGHVTNDLAQMRTTPIRDLK